MDFGNACEGLDDKIVSELERIAQQYESASGIITKMTEWIGDRVEGVAKHLPDNWRERANDAASTALHYANEAAYKTQSSSQEKTWLNNLLTWADGESWHMFASGVTGAAGGMGGFTTILIELPITTTLILRSIQQIAKIHGEDVSDPEVRAQCVAVFGMGGPLDEDDDLNEGLWAIRAGLNGRIIADAIKKAAPRFGIVVSEKALAEAIPILGAAAGAILNPAFVNYYQTMAHVHFGLRKLEKATDADRLRPCFERIVRSGRSKQRTDDSPQI